MECRLLTSDILSNVMKAFRGRVYYCMEVVEVILGNLLVEFVTIDILLLISLIKLNLAHFLINFEELSIFNFTK